MITSVRSGRRTTRAALAALGVLVAGASLPARSQDVATSDSSAASRTFNAQSRWRLQPTDAVPKFIGAPDPSTLGPQHMGMVFSPDPTAMLIGLVVRSIINSSQSNEHRKRMQEQALLEVEVFKPAIAKLDEEPLAASLTSRMRRHGVVRFVGHDAAAAALPGEQIARYEPVFLMTRDRRAVLLDLRLQLDDRGPAEAPRVHQVRVVSTPLDPGDGDRFELTERWNADDGRLLRDTLPRCWPKRSTR